ncbi:MAG: IS66 family insertion sequence element accessory protein TnpB [Candidatus Thiodiazotropha sp.]
MPHYFRLSPSMPNIYLYRDPVDFRKSYRGLAAIVEQELEHNPFEGGLYAFINRRRNKIKYCSGKTTVLCSTTRA